MKKIIIFAIFFILIFNISYANSNNTGIINENKEKGLTYLKNNYNNFSIRYNKNNTIYSFLGIRNMRKLDSIVTIFFSILTIYILLKFLNKQS